MKAIFKPSHLSRCSSCVSGFTLVELSIVIVIIGLIVAGVTAGNALVRQAQLRAVGTNVDKFQAAIYAFKLQYNALPGDFNNASAVWGTACDSTPSNCNGNNDRKIDFTGVNLQNESLRAWQHLYLAALLPVSVTGTGVMFTANNSPAGPIKNSIYFMTYHGTAFFSRATTALSLGLSTGAVWSGANITAAEAQSIDKKMDDGIANKGRMYGMTGNAGGTPAGNCSTTVGVGAGADYNLTGPGPCVLSWFIF